MNQRTLLALTMTFALAFSGISLYLFATRGGEPVDSSRDRVVKIAVEFIRSSPTFQFDGIPETLMLKDYNLLESVPPKHVVTVVFYCRQSGYGNRTGQVLAQVITHHEAVITVVDSTVTSAVIDQIWDEINQRDTEEPSLTGPPEISKLSGFCLNVSIAEYLNGCADYGS